MKALDINAYRFARSAALACSRQAKAVMSTVWACPALGGVSCLSLLSCSLQNGTWVTSRSASLPSLGQLWVQQHYRYSN